MDRVYTAIAVQYWRRLFHRPEHAAVARLQMRDELLRRACCAIRAGKLDLAEGLVMECGDHAGSDAACLNVLGLIAEARDQWTVARRFWTRSVRAGSHYGPAKVNLRRYYELCTFGETDCPVAFGDETAPPVSTIDLNLQKETR